MGRGPVRGVWNSAMGHFSVKMYAKTKELGPMEGGRAPEIFACRSATDLASLLQNHQVPTIKSNTLKCVQSFIGYCMASSYIRIFIRALIGTQVNE